MTFRIIKSWFYRNQEALLLALTLFLFISKSLYNVPFALMALLGLYRLIRSHASVPAYAETRFYCRLFLSLWIPMAVAFMDPVNLERTAQTVWPYLRFLLAGIYILYGMRERNPRSLIENTFFIIITVWSLDAVLQFLTGRNIFGYPYVNGVHITGMFYPELTIGHVLAGVSALYFDSLRQRSRGRRWVWLLLIPLIMVVFLCGRRSIWFMFAVNAFGYFAYRFYLTEFRKRFVIQALLIFVVAGAVVSALYLTQEPVQQRVTKTMDLFSTDMEDIDRATSRRVDTWRTSWRMFRDNWINGVGPRGFRYVYSDYADPDFRFYETSVTHPHMVILEILAESGIIGLAGYILFLCFLASMARRYLHNETCFACFIGVFAATVPVNSHVAFYGSYWSSILWWMIIYLMINMNDVTKAES